MGLGKRTSRLWTILSEAAFATLERKGRLVCDGRRAGCRWNNNPGAYAWMAAAMRRRIGPPPGGVRYPLWAWAQWDGAGRPRPDLRSARHGYGSGRFVLAEIELPDDRVLLSDFHDWHHVLNGWPLAASEAEDMAFDADLKISGASWGWPWPEPFRSRVIASWERIFDLDSCVEGWTPPRAERSIQASFWELRIPQVRSVRPFAGMAAKAQALRGRGRNSGTRAFRPAPLRHPEKRT